MPGKLRLYGLYVYYVVHICDFGMLRVNIVEARLIFLNFDVCIVWCSDGSIKSRAYKSLEIYVVPNKISMTEYHNLINPIMML